MRSWRMLGLREAVTFEGYWKGGARARRCWSLTEYWRRRLHLKDLEVFLKLITLPEYLIFT